MMGSSGGQRRAIVHIGMPRTASSTLQSVLHLIRDALPAAGVLYPDLTPPARAAEAWINHQPLGEALDGRRPEPEAAALLARLADELRSTAADTVVLSYEDWCQARAADAIAPRLCDTVRACGFTPQVLMLVRPQAEHLNSVYGHRMLMLREWRGFPAFARAYAASARLRYAERLAAWSRAAEGRAVVVPLRDRRDDRPLVRRVLEAVDLGSRLAPLAEAVDLTGRDNRSPGPVAVAVARRLHGWRVQDRLSVMPRRMMDWVQAQAVGRGLDGATFQGVTPVLRHRVEAACASANARFAEAAWGAGWDDVVAPGPVAPNALDAPLAPDVDALVAGLAEEACERFGVAPGRPPTAWRSDAAEAAAEWAVRRLPVSHWRVA